MIEINFNLRFILDRFYTILFMSNVCKCLIISNIMNDTKKNRILIFHPYLAPYRIDLYNRLSDKYDIYVLLTGSKDEIKTLGFNLDLVNSQARFKFQYITDGLRLGRHLISSVFLNIIKKFDPDIILSHELGSNTLFAILANKIKKKYKIYTTVDDSPAMVCNYGRLRNWLREFVANNIDGFIVVNPEVKNYLENRYPKLKNKVIYFPIIQDDKILSQKINLSENKAIDLQKRYNLYDKRIILFVGRLETIKSPDLLLRVFKRVKTENNVLVIVGSGSLSDSLCNYVKQYNIENVILTGKLSGKDLYAWYYLADIFVLPSKFEPFGAVVNEALVAGCYTIVSNKVGASSLITSSNGIIFDINNVDTFEDVLKRALINLPPKKSHNSLMNKTFSEYFVDLLNKLEI